jgi:hypothetical protein
MVKVGYFWTGGLYKSTTCSIIPSSTVTDSAGVLQLSVQEVANGQIRASPQTNKHPLHKQTRLLQHHFLVLPAPFLENITQKSNQYLSCIRAHNIQHPGIRAHDLSAQLFMHNNPVSSNKLVAG